MVVLIGLSAASAAAEQTTNPPGGQILFSDNGNLFLVNPDGGGLTQITRGGGIAGAEFPGTGPASPSTRDPSDVGTCS